jgi:ElaB/YqjD/DUF883 family membrane-anchored ribosome-binding protein
MDLERIAKLETKVEAIQEDVKDVREDIKELHSRVSTQTREIVEKIDDMQTRIEHKMQAGALSATKQHNDIRDEIQSDFKELASNLHSDMKTLDADIKEVTKRVDVLEQWRWMIVGGAIAIGYIIGHIDLFTKFFK